MSTQPRKSKKKKSLSQTAREDAFNQGITLFNEAKQIPDAENRKLAERAAIRYFIPPLSPKFIIGFVSLSALIALVVVLIVVVKLPAVAASIIVMVIIFFWLAIAGIALALGNVFSETVLAKLLTTMFGKLLAKLAIWASDKSDQES